MSANGINTKTLQNINIDNIENILVSSSSKDKPLKISISEFQKYVQNLISNASVPQYIAKIEQFGTNDPSVLELIDDLSLDLSWTREGVGVYAATLPSTLFQPGIVISPLQVIKPTTGNGPITFSDLYLANIYLSGFKIIIETFTFTGSDINTSTDTLITRADGILNSNNGTGHLEIKFYSL